MTVCILLLSRQFLMKIKDSKSGIVLALYILRRYNRSDEEGAEKFCNRNV